MRTREVWVHAVDLDNGASFKNVPSPVLVRLLKDITGARASRGTDRGLTGSVDGDPSQLFGDMEARAPLQVTGSLADVVCWATGRGVAGVTASRDDEVISVMPAAPSWI
jgi:maleylpyruvate isomerase